MSEESLPSSPITVHSDEDAEIAALAYRFYCQEECPEGKAHEHWLRAEQEVRGKLRPRIPKVRQPKLRPRVLGPRILRSKSNFPREYPANAVRIEGLGVEVTRAFRLAGRERVLENAFFGAVCLGREIRWLFVISVAVAARSAFL